MTETDYPRPGIHAYFMLIAMAVRKRANCTGNRVGAVMVVDNHIVSTGYNGTPEGFANCLEGGCYRCSHSHEFESGTGYDLCICVHAEQNALLFAARYGIAVEGGTLYSTMRPCFGCTKELLQAKVASVYYLHDWIYPDPRMQEHYLKLQAHFSGGVHHLPIDDPEEVWAVRSKRKK